MDISEARDVAEQAADWIAAELAKGEDHSGKLQDFHDAIRAVVLALDSHEDASTPAFDEIAKLCGCPTWEYPGQVVRDVELVVKQRDELRASWDVGIAELTQACEAQVALVTAERDRARALADVRGNEVARLADECGTAKGQRDNLRRAVRAALAVWCPHPPGGDGADGETYELCTAALEGRGRHA